MDDYDSAWNGVEVYVSTRSMDLYNEIEHHYQTAVTEALNKPNPDTTAILADAKAMLAKYDEMLALVEKSMPLNRLYDDVIALRVERGGGTEQQRRDNQPGVFTSHRAPRA